MFERDNDILYRKRQRAKEARLVKEVAKTRGAHGTQVATRTRKRRALSRLRRTGTGSGSPHRPQVVPQDVGSSDDDVLAEAQQPLDHARDVPGNVQRRTGRPKSVAKTVWGRGQASIRRWE